MIPSFSLRLLRKKRSFLHHLLDRRNQILREIKPATHYFTPVRWENTNSRDKNDPIDLTSFPVESMRNFSIIAHVDHGKSTLADRILEVTGAIKRNDSNKQVLDTLQVERERGITVKAQSASMVYHYKGKPYLLNLIDTPGHVDFSYEVSRAVAACQGVILLVDANQGVQAQTVANFYLAFTKELYILPVLNKIDLKNAEPELVAEQLKDVFEIEPSSVLKVSAKMGIGITELLDAVVERIPSPAGSFNPDSPFRALLYDSWYDKYKGVICLIVVVDGHVKLGNKIEFFHTKKSYEVKSLSMLTPVELPVKILNCGQVGIVTASIKAPKDAIVGDTLYKKGAPTKPLEGFQEAKPMVYAGIYSMDQTEKRGLQIALEKLALNDSSVTMTQEVSAALGQGWRIGFLGLLHMEVFTSRLEQEYSADVIITTPSVPYKVKYKPGKKRENKMEEIIVNPQQWPDPTIVEETQEPIVRATIIAPHDRLSAVMSLCERSRGTQIDMRSIEGERMILTYRLPLNEIIIDFFDELKSLTSGYATFDYEDAGYVTSSMVKLVIHLNQQPVEELCVIVNISKVRDVAKNMCQKLLESLPRQQFGIAIQGVVGGKIVARENIRSYRKDVTAKLYGGDVTRKMKLLKKQSEGKKKMKMVGNIEVPREIFIDVLKK